VSSGVGILCRGDCKCGNGKCAPVLRGGFGSGREWPSGGTGEVGLGKLHLVEAKTRAGLPYWGVGAADWVAVGL
jgi:hypothetical protein